MKNWWQNLALREKQAVLLGGLLLILLIFYSFIWLPLSNSADNLRNKIHHNQELLLWMQDTDEKMQAIEHNLKQPSQTRLASSLLSLVQHELQKSPINNAVSQLRQAENNAVQMHVEKVSFDELITWLTTMWQNFGLLVTEINVMLSGQVGMVQGEITLNELPR